MKRAFTCLFVLGVGVFLGLPTWADIESSHTVSVADQIRFPVEKFKLNNGLTVLIHEDHSSPIFSYHQWFRVGSRHEQPGRTGLAHFFEHLMFKGTDKHPGKDYEKLIQGNGGSNNAFTNRDYTGYYTNLPSGKLPLVVDIESDRLVNLNFVQSEINSEREVVKEERRFRTENNVMGTIWESLFSTVYKVHPYRWPVVGSMKDLNAASMQDMKDFYRIYYAPNNSVVVVAGAVDTKEAKKLITEYYSKIPAQSIPAPKFVKEPEQGAPRKTTIRKDVQNATVAVSYLCPKSGEDDVFALDLMSSILGEGSSSRLYKDLVYEKQLASSTSSFAYSMAEEGVCASILSLKPGKSSTTALRHYQNQLSKLRTTPVSDKELEKAKTMVIKGYVDSMKTVAGKARLMALNEILFSDYSEMFKDIDRYNAVSKQDIMRVANKYLVPKKQSVIQVLPKK